MIGRALIAAALGVVLTALGAGSLVLALAGVLGGKRLGIERDDLPLAVPIAAAAMIAVGATALGGGG